MGKKEKIEALIEGGKATAAPPLGPALGPMGVNIGQVIAEINKKTEDFKGMKVPVKVIIDTETRNFEIEIGTPPTSQLVKKELGIDKGSGLPQIDKVGNIAIEQIVKIAKMKSDSIFHKDFKSIIKVVIGTCNSLGLLIEGMTGSEAVKAVDEGKFDDIINQKKTEVTPEKKNQLSEQLEVFRKAHKKDLKRIKASAVDKKEEKAEKEPAAKAKK